MTLISSWRSPSNIALIKYWGKHGTQLPNNPSLSFTLSACHTDMFIKVTPESSAPSLTVLYAGNERPAFEPKIKSFLQKIYTRVPWLQNAAIIIDSVNTFPHGAGIASSASAMSALALCITSIDSQINSQPENINNLSRKYTVSEMARLASGSACRSVFPVAALWGEVKNILDSSDLHAIPWADHISDVYKDYQDTILVVSAEEKGISSTAGHQLMNDHPYAAPRFAQANLNLSSLITAMNTNDNPESFISICESEALHLHALMMSSKTPFILMESNTVSIIKEVWRFRKETSIPVCFTLDAGPNVHLLYPSSFRPSVLDWIKSRLTPYCIDGLFLLDENGSGPERLT
ncbi:MAG: diphosphomevalonate decarboxylase [Saprospiraceae bacterium]